MKTIEFLNINDSIQYLSDLTNQKVVVSSYSREVDNAIFDARESLKDKEDIHPDNIDVISRDPEASYDVAYQLIVRDREVPEQLEKSIIKDESVLNKYYEELKYRNKPISKIIKNEIFNSTKIATYTKEIKDAHLKILDLMKNNEEVREDLEDIISKDELASYDYAFKLIEKDKEVPLKIEKSLIKDPEYAYWYAEALEEKNKKVPVFVEDAIRGSEFEEAYFFVSSVLNKKSKENKMNEEIKFSSTKEAIQYLADLTGEEVRIANYRRKFIVDFDILNDAFAENPELEVSRILREIADKVENGNISGKIRDINGNQVGIFKIK